jgi:hypothetical protein
MPSSSATGLAVLALVLLGCPARATEPEAIAFFERKIRPVLLAHCVSCHSAEAKAAKKLKAGLYLDTRDGLLRGGDSGPAVVPGKPGDSLLVRALKYDGDLRMPPKGKLTDAVVTDIVQWVAMGAPDPRRGPSAPGRQTGMSLEEGRRFWAYRRPTAPALPAVRAAHWAQGDVDCFILARLEGVGLAPAPDADRPTLARRLYYDLTGLPPAPAEVEAFVKDADPLAWEKLVDRLLASPAFGERWGRHWLDVARFAESLTLRGILLKDAWRYRDYVIETFNRDVPFARFVREQLAGDLLPAASVAERRRQLVATSFLALGNTNLEEQDKKQLRLDVVDEQLDVITKGFLAQTVTCARCHDHKFDPIPTRDYYALAGILRNARALEHANVSQPVEVTLPVEADEEAVLAAHEARVAGLQARIKLAREKAGAGTPARGVLAVAAIPGVVVDDAAARKVGVWQHSTFTGTYIGAGYVHDQDSGKGEKTITFQPDLPATGRYEVRLAYSPGQNRADAVPVTVFGADGEKTIAVDMQKPPPLDGRWISLGNYRFEKAGQSFVLISNEGTRGHVTADAVVFVPLDPAGQPARQSADAKSAVRTLEEELKRLQQHGPRRPAVVSVVEEKVIEDARVHVRGLVQNLGEPVPRGFLQVATAATPALPANQSGRKELADWIASADNPLTARVIVNRVWLWLFGAGLVRTPDNFGTTGDRPTHPELLDYLAVRFIEDGWSLKNLVRRIVLSRTYRQSAAADSRAVAADPENHWFGRANRRRLDAECIRDTILAVSGKLSPERGGRTYPEALAADYGFKTADCRRSVYLPVFRNALPEELEVFDFADPSVVTGKRNDRTVAQQALFFLNHPFPIEQSRHAAARLLAQALPDDAARVSWAYRLTLGRTPSAGERAVALRFLSGRQADVSEAWAALFQALFASADFRYVN